MSSVYAPYNFVPLSEHIYLPDEAWAAQVSHDVPFSDGISGVLNIDVECITPFLIGGDNTPATDQRPGQVNFFKLNGEPVIPPTSTKGMLSNVLQIASFGRFKQVADTRYGVRDLATKKNRGQQQASGNFYTQRMNQGSQAGWLTFDQEKGEWRVTPCQKTRIHQGDLIKHFGIKEADWCRAKKAPDRYKRHLKGLRDLDFTLQPNPRGCRYVTELAIPVAPAKVAPDSLQGKVVVTGQPGKNFNEGAGNKQYEFVFYKADKEADQVLDSQVYRDFRFIHQESAEWKYWMGSPINLQTGIPVFYLTDGQGKITSLGLASMFKLAYSQSTHDAIRNTAEGHLDEANYDLSELLFGRISNTDDSADSLRGRVHIGLGRVIDPQYVTYSETCKTVLNTPKPTYYPSYLEQKSHSKYTTFMDANVRLRGWKRYPARSGDFVPPAEGKVKSELTRVVLHPVDRGTRFSVPIRVHNLRPVELGALLWTLDFGGRKDCYHSLGAGKPFGMGQLKLTIKSQKLLSNTGIAMETDDLLDCCRFAFLREINDFMQRASNGKFAWIESPQVKELLAMASPDVAPSELSYMSLGNGNEFVKAKGTTDNLAPHSTRVSEGVWAATERESDWLTRFADEQQLLDYLCSERKKAQAAEVAEAQRQEARASMSEALLLIDDLSQRIEKLRGGVGKSADLNKQMRELAKLAPQWSDKEKQGCQGVLKALSPEMITKPKDLKKLQNALG